MNSSVERQSELFGLNLHMQPDTWFQEKKLLLEFGCSVLVLSLCSCAECCGSHWVTLLCPCEALTVTLNLFILSTHCAEFLIYHQEFPVHGDVTDVTLIHEACQDPLWAGSFLWG